ncbi:MAG: cell division protein FtsQ/DivIB [Roseburia sp.]|nr:cell division protein FtsQ/DivIB [Ruminococcus sp.]MCM1154427.1 cell division protein FtsQ/DivIB [Roseburia sp.]MCM1241883.1 cell division protein FtsQ/DivIB [Roseburia sp.]
MSSRNVVKKGNKRATNLRLVRNNTAKGKQKEQKVRFSKAKRIAVLSAICCILAVSAAGAYVYIMDNYTITTVYVDGNIHYTNEEIMEMVMNGKYGNNSLFLSLKYRDKGVEDIPFIETMDVTIEAKDTVRITVYEKAIAGYVAYLGRYMYFDKDGIIVETSEEKTPGIPQVTGLVFDRIILHEALPVDNPAVFQDILTITQLLDKYSLPVDKIYFSSDYQVTLIFGDVKAALGNSGDIDEKIMQLQYMLPSLEGRKGTLDMREYTEDTKLTSFEQD